MILILTSCSVSFAPNNGEPSPPGGDTGPGGYARLFWFTEEKIWLGQNGLAFYLGPELPPRADGSLNLSLRGIATPAPSLIFSKTLS